MRYGGTDGRAKLTYEDVCEILGLIRDGMKQKAIGARFDVSQSTVSEIVCGYTWRCVPEVERDAAMAAARRKSNKCVNPLTKAEIEVLKLMACGLTSKQIAAVRGTTPRTTREQRSKVTQALNVKNGHQAAFYAWRKGIITIDEAWATLQAVSR